MFNGICKSNVGQFYSFLENTSNVVKSCRHKAEKRNFALLRIADKIIRLICNDSLLSSLALGLGDVLTSLLEKIKILDNSRIISPNSLENMSQSFVQELEMLGNVVVGTEIESAFSALLCVLANILEYSTSCGCDAFGKQASAVYMVINLIATVDEQIKSIPVLKVLLG